MHLWSDGLLHDRGGVSGPLPLTWQSEDVPPLLHDVVSASGRLQCSWDAMKTRKDAFIPIVPQPPHPTPHTLPTLSCLSDLLRTNFRSISCLPAACVGYCHLEISPRRDGCIWFSSLLSQATEGVGGDGGGPLGCRFCMWPNLSFGLLVAVFLSVFSVFQLFGRHAAWKNNPTMTNSCT